MAYRYHSRRSYKKLVKSSQRNFIITLILIVLLTYITIKWLLPYFVNGIGFVKDSLKPAKKVADNLQSSLAPPILNIPYEATNSAQINIKGYGTPNSQVAIFLDDEKKDIVEVAEDGSFKIKDLQLSLGTNNIFGKSIDEENQESLPSKLIKIIYDNEKPKLEVTEPEDDKKITGGDKKVKISGNNEVGARVFVNDNQIIVDKEGNFSTAQDLNEGENSFNIKAVDSASNETEIFRKVTYSP